MAFILNIETAVQAASVCLAEGDLVIGQFESASERDSASWLHVEIQEILQQHNILFSKIDAVAVSVGPGSYTGLRVGMAAAKGLCYALSLPLIEVSTLQMMAAAAQPDPAALFCPMIDARRLEVFTALYDAELNEVMPATNLILEDGCFNEWLDEQKVLFFGNGSQKAVPFLKHPNAFFSSVIASARHMAPLSKKKFALKQFADLAYSEPFYGKQFYSPPPKKNR